MNANIALAPFSSCQTRLIRAKLFRRVHWLWLLLFHAYSMPMNLCFFKPPSFSPVSGVLPNSLIFRDAYQVAYHVEERELPVSKMGRNYREFGISEQRALRVRVLHPDKPEYATGADLIYENYWETGKIKLVRFAALQYKVWKNKTLYIDERMKKQLEKMKATFCDKTFCDEGKDSRRKDAYRLPYCSAFLRPTDELQSENANLMSTGCYAPICAIKRKEQSTAKGNGVLYSKDIRNEAVTHKVFEEVFNINMLGSRWLTYDELEQLYHDANILEPDEHIIIHAQEF